MSPDEMTGAMATTPAWRVRWSDAWRALGAVEPDAGSSERELESLLRRYEGPSRRYHTRQHLEECFARLESVPDRVAHPAEVAVALFYHDAVYDTHASDNEARSAELAASAMRERGIAPDAVARVRALILATRHADEPATPEEALLVDVDLGILAAPAARFDEYERQVREEFAWVPGILFRRKRREVLETFLARPRIYASGAFDADEVPARRNLARSLAALVTVLAVVLAIACAPAASVPGPILVSATAQSSGTTQLLIAVHAVSDSIVWASGARGTVIRTIDGGAHWTAMRVPGADSLQFRDIHATDARTAWVLSIGSGASSRIYRTDDAGANWTRQFTNPDEKGFYDCLEFWDAEHGLAIGDAIGSEMALLRTDDGGAHWTRIPPPTLPRALEGEGSFAASGTCIAMQRGGRAWIIMNTPTASRLIRTADHGRTWALETLPITTHEGSGAQSVIFRDARHGMVLGGGYQVRAGDTLVAVTEDGGDTWTPRAAPAFKVGTWGGSWIPGARVPTVVAVGPSGSAWSRDGGATWVAIDTLNYWSVGFSSARTGWAVGTQGKVTRLDGW